MNLSRQYKLWKLGISVDSEYLKIFEFMDSKILNLQPFECFEYPGSVFYMDNYGSCVFENRTSANQICVKYDGLWEKMEKYYCIEYPEVQKFLCGLIEYNYKINDEVSKYTSYSYSNVWHVAENMFRPKSMKF